MFFIALRDLPMRHSLAFQKPTLHAFAFAPGWAHFSTDPALMPGSTPQCYCHLAFHCDCFGQSLSSQNFDPGRTRTCNLWFRRPTPYPLGHRATCRCNSPRTIAFLSKRAMFAEQSAYIIPKEELYIFPFLTQSMKIRKGSRTSLRAFRRHNPSLADDLFCRTFRRRIC